MSNLLDKATNIFESNYLPKPSKNTLRKIGIELEFPVVNNEGEAVNYKIIRKLFQSLKRDGWSLNKDEGTSEVVSAERLNSNGVGRFGYNKDVIGTDVGYCTIETSLTPESNLFELVNHWGKIRGILLSYLKSNNTHLLGYGVQPITKPQKKIMANKGRYKFFEQDSLNRFIDQQDGVDLHVFATSAANQCHIDVYKEEAIEAVNTLNGLAPLFTSLTANSSVWKGEVDQNWLDVREIFWDKSWSNRVEQVGIPDKFNSFKDYVDRICSFRPLMVKRGKEYIKIIGCATFLDYLKNGKNNRGENAKGKIVHLKSELQDVQFQNGFAWWQARLASSYGTIEIRPCAQQPPNATMAVAALSLGIIENLQKATKLYERFSLSSWRKLRFDALRHGLNSSMQEHKVATSKLAKELLQIAEEGLKTRRLGEEVLLDVLFERLNKKETPADVVKRIFNKKNIKPFLRFVEI